MAARPDLLILDCSEAVIAAAAALRHHGPAYPDDDRRRAGDLLRLAENRLRQARRRLEAGLTVPTDADRIVDRMISDGWLEAAASLRPALVAAVSAELVGTGTLPPPLDLDAGTLPARQTESRTRP